MFLKNKWCKFYRNDICFNLGKNINTGRLSITVRNKENDEPITFAEVSLFLFNIRGFYGEVGDGILIARHVTDDEGRVPVIELPIIDKNAYPLSQYYMTVKHFRFYPVNVMGIEIYTDVTTEYTILLTPLTSKHPDYEFIITPIRR